MEVQRFEQAILKMAFETDAKITTASVAYYLGIPSRKANELLETLLAEGVLELDSDDEGNLYYYLPHQGGPLSSGEFFEGDHRDDGWEQLEAAADRAAAQDSTPPASSSPSILAEHFTASLDDEPSAAPTFSPALHSPSSGPGADGESRGRTAPSPGPDQWSYSPPRQEDPFAPPTSSPSYGQPRSFSPTPRPSSTRFGGLPDGFARRLGRPDARPNHCGSNSVIVESAASCEPRPLAESRPTVTSCTEVSSSQFSSNHEYGGFGFAAPRSSTALATTSGAGELTLTDNHIEQPEHQPGMALLLSLILCGTGQIYNGEVSKGIIMLILCFLLWFVFLGWVVHIWSIVDAVVVAERINRNSNGQ